VGLFFTPTLISPVSVPFQFHDLITLWATNLEVKWFNSGAKCPQTQLRVLLPLPLQKGSSRSAVLSVLLILRQSTHVALQREPQYWLVYNGVVLVYTIGRKMMSLGYSAQVLEYLLWGAVCMESSVPLMAVKYLQLRVNLYMAVCQCYYDIRQPYQAELFARRGLDKVHELAQLEHQSSSEVTKSSEEVFRESALKLGVMVFKRSVLESRKKSKSIFRPKVRPTIRDQLQLPTPR